MNLKHEKYQPTDKGPFILFGKHKDGSPINDICLANNLNKRNLINKKVISIKNTSKNCVKIVCESFMTANQLLKVQLDNVNLEIPKSFLYIEGVVSIPLQLNENDISSNITSEAPIAKIERMTRWNHQTQQAEPTNNMKITFRASELPRKIDLMCVPIKVYYYIPSPTFCKTCFRFGHTKKYCKATNTCKNCLSTHTATICNEPEIKCRYCPDANHYTGHKDCPETQKQKSIKEYMIKNKTSYNNALKDLQLDTKPQQTFSINEFPPLEHKNSQLSARLQEFQDPKSKINQIDNLKTENTNLKSLINEIVTLLAKENKENPLIKEIKTSVQYLEKSKQNPLQELQNPNKNNENITTAASASQRLSTAGEKTQLIHNEASTNVTINTTRPEVHTMPAVTEHLSHTTMDQDPYAVNNRKHDTKMKTYPISKNQ